MELAPGAARTFAILGAANAFLAVALGAFGAHALRGRLAPGLDSTYHTASQYHFYHALGLIAIALLMAHLPDATMLRAAGWTMLAGIVLFSGSLYLLAITGIPWLGAITPLGGVAFLAAWVLVAVALARAPR